MAQRGISPEAAQEAVATAKTAGNVTAQMGKYGTPQEVYRGANGITVIVETVGSNGGKAITAYFTGTKP